jgi:hypothetical protein
MLINEKDRYTANKLIKSIVETEMIEMKKKIKLLEDIEKLSNINRIDDDLDSTNDKISDFVKSQNLISKSKIKKMLMDECKR